MARHTAARWRVCVAVVVASVLLQSCVHPVLAAKSWTNQLSTKDNGEVFLKGHYIEVGMHAAGSFGTARLPTTSGFNGKSHAGRSWSYGTQQSYSALGLVVAMWRRLTLVLAAFLCHG